MSPISTKQQKVKTGWSTYVTNINKTKESLNSDGQHMSPISTKQQKLKTVMVNKCHQYQQNNRKFKQ